MRFLFRLLLLLFLVMAAWAVFAGFAPKRPSSEFVLLRTGMGTRQIASELERAGVIRNEQAFLALHLLTGRSPLKAGEYRFDQPASMLEVHDRIARGDIYFHTIVIPEGFNVFDIATAFEAAGLAKKQEVLNLARTRLDLIADLDPQARTLEGYLFPDTYKFTRTQSAADMLGAMVKRFRQEAQDLGLRGDFHRLVTMASIVEKETSVPAERPIVASVFYNRLGQRIGLATDPSVIYAALLANRWDGIIHQSDLQFDHPYNTYKYAGLPPGPIASPGRDSLQAAMNPANTDYIYFVADNTGGHRFARTLDEHNRNVAAFRRGLAAAQRR